MSIAEMLTQIAENEQRVYDAGKESEYDVFWDSFQNYGNRTYYTNTFYNEGWNDKNFKPKYDIKPVGSVSSFVGGGIRIDGDMSEHMNALGVSFDLSDVTNMSNAFRQIAGVTRMPAFEFTKVNADFLYNFYFNQSLETIDKIIFADGCNITSFTGTLSNNYKLKNLTIEGKIGAKGLNLSASTMLSKESITSVINALSDTTSGLTVTLSKTAKENAFTTEEWATLIATKQNWTITLA